MVIPVPTESLKMSVGSHTSINVWILMNSFNCKCFVRPSRGYSSELAVLYSCNWDSSLLTACFKFIELVSPEVSLQVHLFVLNCTHLAVSQRSGVYVFPSHVTALAFLIACLVVNLVIFVFISSQFSFLLTFTNKAFWISLWLASSPWRS